jgi:hypothetical protein
VLSTRKYISNKEMETSAMQKYRRGGHGLTFDDVRKEFSVNKDEAQRRLKYFHAKEVLFTANDLISEGIIVLKNKSPQEYFPTCIKAEIIAALTKQKNVQVNPSEVTHSSVLTSSDSIDQTLEDYVLPLLPEAPLHIHNIHLKTKISTECYLELSLSPKPGNNGKRYSEIVGTSSIDYTLYPNGTVIVEVTCSNHPFKLQTEQDRSRLLVFFGQVRQVLTFFLKDPHERIVPDIMEWELTECDINKDIKVSNWFHYTGLRIQLRHIDHLFCLYVKPMGKDTVYRIEERKQPHKPPLEFINDIFNPVDRVEKQIAEFKEEQENKLSAIHNLLSRFLESKD